MSGVFRPSWFPRPHGQSPLAALSTRAPQANMSFTALGVGASIVVAVGASSIAFTAVGASNAAPLPRQIAVYPRRTLVAVISA